MRLCIPFKTQKATGFPSRKHFWPHFPCRPVHFPFVAFLRLVVFRRVIVSPALAVFFRFRVYTYALFRRFFLSTQATVFCRPSPPQKHCSKRPGAGWEFPIAKRNPHAKPGLFVCGHPPSRYRQTPKGYKTA